jgi:serine phosphatase RsbU (regulator of sigma subunit)/anti-sigma regulatory factor (Ser/Thr protein kinase)
MITWIQNSWKNWFAKGAEELPIEKVVAVPTEAPMLDLDIAPDDAFLAYLLNVSGVVEVEQVNLDSPALRSLKEAGIKISVPLVSQGELIGLLNLGPRRSEQEYSTDDRRLLTTLATQAAPALRVAQLVRQQQAEALERERIQQELRVARVIQQTLLPKEVPDLPGWQMDAFWKPARAVSGDFYDFIPFPDGRLGIVVADVTDKGMPAALVMATTRSILRSAAEHLIDPGAVLRRANDMLYPDIPTNMFVTCLYALLDPRSGYLRYANAGHNLPFQRTPGQVVELRARGMPLGLMPDMDYEEKETTLDPGDNMVLYSDGLVEAHNPEGQMFGTPRLQQMLSTPQCGRGLIDCLMGELDSFTGPGWEQEDDVTFVIVDRLDQYSTPDEEKGMETIIAKFSLPSQPGNEREAMERVADAVGSLELPNNRVERLKTAVAEATMNAMEHGNRYQPEVPVEVAVKRRGNDLLVSICDCGGDRDIPESQAPDLAAKLEGMQSPRGWGLFLIKNMVDDMHISSDGKHHIVELVMHLEGEQE